MIGRWFGRRGDGESAAKGDGSPASSTAPPSVPPVELPPIELPPFETVAVDALGDRIGAPPIDYPASSRERAFLEWKMEIDDAPIFRYLYRHLRPRRHLEFGTWRGTGALYCLEESDATVWTINLRDGEAKSDGEWAYGELRSESGLTAPGLETQAAEKEGHRWVRTDAGGAIGEEIHRAGYGARVCQVFCDSREWETRDYPADFFDTALIDGGHQKDVVISDTRKAFAVTRPGGTILWHDYCPAPEVVSAFPATHGVASALAEVWDELSERCAELYWIEPSFIAVARLK